MALNRDLRNELRNTVTRCRRILEEAVADDLEGRFAIARSGHVAEASGLDHLTALEMESRAHIVSHFEHMKAGGLDPRDAAEQLVREVSYTHLNRLCAYKMLERRRLIRESVGRGVGSNGFMFYLAEHPEDERSWSSGEQGEAYRNFLIWLGGTLSEEVGALFAAEDPANNLFPPHRTLNEVLGLINADELDAVWDSEETIGWVYQYYTPKELRDKARKESPAPRNSYELSFRNQFYTPNYVVRFLADNTLGRTWHEMRRGDTRLTDECEYMVLRGDEDFPEPYRPSSNRHHRPLETDEIWTRPNSGLRSIGHIFEYALTFDGYEYAKARLGMECGDLANERIKEYRRTDVWRGTFEELRCCLFFEQRRWRHFGYAPEGEDLENIKALYRAICERWNSEAQTVPSRAPKDPRDIRVLDPASGSGHFLLYCFDLLEVIYEEAYDADDDIGAALRGEYSDREGYMAAVPAMILRHNLHGMDIDIRATQISALALWLRAQRSFEARGIKRGERLRVSRSNIVCAEPMPGEEEMLSEFAASLDPPLLGRLVETVFEGMKLAGEAGSLLRIEAMMASSIEAARRQWRREIERDTDARGDELLFTGAEMDRLSGRADDAPDLSQIDDAEFWNRVENLVLEALENYAGGGDAPDATRYRRRLFAEDAERGFAFVEMCRKRFDVVLMNPPFGEASRPSKGYIDKNYPRTKNDVYAAFVERGLSMLHPGGMLGAITSRTGFFLSSFRKWREEIILGEARPTVVADLGQGVLDTAMVETAAYVLEKSRGAKPG